MLKKVMGNVLEFVAHSGEIPYDVSYYELSLLWCDVTITTVSSDS